MRILTALLIIVPALEIGLFIGAGKTIGVVPTVGLIIVTGVLGAYLAKKQGLEALNTMQEQMRRGEPPGEALLDGVCILTGGILLLTPGFITDATGLLLLFRPARNRVKPLLLQLFRRWFSRKRIYIYR